MRLILLTTSLWALHAASAPLEHLFPRQADFFNLSDPNVFFDLSDPAFVDTLPIVKRDSTDTRNELINGPCKAVTVIYARGTTESGNVGTVLGPTFFNALNSAIGAANFAVQGVAYPASILGYLQGGDNGGASTLASLANTAATKCPTTKIVLSGYSQGAQVVHKGAPKLAAGVAARVSAVVMFGDPDKGQALTGISAGIVDTICHPADLICQGMPIVGPEHLNYGLDAPAAAAFVKGKVGL